MLLIGSALFLGCLHGLGADHLMAITALSARRAGHPAGGGIHPVRIAVGFAFGHAVLLALGAGAIIVLGWNIPAAVEQAGELLAGVLLVGLGVVALWAVAKGRVYVHAHPHGASLQHDHAHVHVGRPAAHPAPAEHSHVPTVLGAVFAIGGLRALAMLAPFDGRTDAAASLVVLLGLIAVFALGIVLSMSLFGLVLAHVVDRGRASRHAGRLGRAAAVATALGSIALGLYWIAQQM